MNCPIILAIDTSSAQGLIALQTASGAILSRRNEQQREHNQFILPALDALLAEANLQLDDIDYFAASRGPGSFVGTRLAVAVVQGLAFGIKKPVVGTSHLALIAAASQASTVILDAKMQGYYQAHFENGILLGAETFQRFDAAQPPLFTPIPVLHPAHLIHLAEQEISAGRIFQDPSLLQPVYLHDEGNWKKHSILDQKEI